MVNGKSFKYECYEIGYAELAFQKKCNFSQEIPAPKDSSSSGTVAAGKKCLLQKNTFSKQLLILKK